MKRIRVIVPVSTSIWNEPTIEEMKKYRDADTQLDVIHTVKGPESIECTYDEAWSELFTILEAEKAEAEGYDGVIIYCFGDPGVRGAKEKLTIPVVGLMEPSILMASLLGNKFSILVTGPLTAGKCQKGITVDKIKMYGAESRCASIRSVGMPVLELERDKAEETEKLLREANKAVTEDGADTIVLGCGAIFGIETAIREALGVPVVVPAGAALKVLEDLIVLKIAQSKVFFAAPPIKKRQL